LANKGVREAIKTDKSLQKGVNTIDGKLTYKAVAEAFGVKYQELDKLIK